LNPESRSAAVSEAFEAAVERELDDLSARDLRGPAERLSARYRFPGAVERTADFALGELQAYLATRVLATFAATRSVLAEMSSLRSSWAPRTVLDLGAGPGTATWAAASVFGSIERAVLVERDPQMAALGLRLAQSSPSGLLPESSWSIGDAGATTGQPSDLVVAAYVLGELGPHREGVALEHWWRATLGELVLIEPGTPAGFERLRAARTALIDRGAFVTAPCPHDDRCPLQAPDWCHFAVRLTRSPLHRESKRARLGYEDEKYSYVVVSANRGSRAAARLVRSPRAHKGHVRLRLCEAAGLNERVVSRRDGDLYKRARAARWGERLDLGSESS
jgi:ribosomal protein RSM22 (predicted rRNA methylase)